MFVHRRHVVSHYGKHLYTASFFYFVMREAFFRHCGYSEFDLIASDVADGAADEIEEELTWARARPGVIARREEIEQGIRDIFGEDDSESIYGALTTREYNSVFDAQLAKVKGIFDASQNYSQRARISKNGRLMTLVKHTGCLVAWDRSEATLCSCGAYGSDPPMSGCECFRGRLPIRRVRLVCRQHNVLRCAHCFDESHADTLMSARECLAAMGLPVQLPQIAEARVASSFATYLQPPSTRTRASMVHQAGNGMLTCHCTAMLFLAILFSNGDVQREVLVAIRCGLWLLPAQLGQPTLYPDEVTPERAQQHEAKLASLRSSGQLIGRRDLDRGDDGDAPRSKKPRPVVLRLVGGQATSEASSSSSASASASVP
jgi:hypothetical protein